MATTKHPFAELLPAWWSEHPVLTLQPWQWLGLLVTLGVAYLVAVAVRAVMTVLVRKLAKRRNWGEAELLATGGPGTLFVWVVAAQGGVHALGLNDDAAEVAHVVLRTLAIVSFVWMLLRLLALVVAAVERQPMLGDAQSRGLRTQLVVIRRIAQVAIWVLGIAALLMQFDVVRTVGVSLLASAGLVSVVLGLAAQRSFASLFAGIQLSLTQPVRLGDVVVIEGLYGTVEEIHLTYLVIRVWDLRRLVVPISMFLEKPFENWSRAPEPLLGAVLLKVDFAADPAALRAELDRVLEVPEVKKLWDGKVKTVMVTDSDERSQTIRVLVGAADTSMAFDLRCAVRERLLDFIKSQPGWLPRGRLETLTSVLPQARTN